MISKKAIHKNNIRTTPHAISFLVAISLAALAGLFYLQSVYFMIKSNEFPCETPDYIEPPLGVVIEFTPVCPKEYGETRRIGRKLEKAALATLGAAAIIGVTTELSRRRSASKSKVSKNKKYTSSHSGKPKN